MKKSYIAVGHYGGDPVPVSQVGADVYLLHLPTDNRNAEVIRAANLNAQIWGRFDDGEDNQQVDTSKPANGEAHRWWRFLNDRIQASPPGTFDGVVGICEAWGTDLQWRADFEEALCWYVQEQKGLHYAWGSIPVGNLEPEQIAIFAPVIREAYAVNYHGYLKEGNTALSQETEPFHLWRPLDLWLPECRRLGIPLPRILLGEVGTYFCWQPLMSREAYADLCIDVARAFGRRCETEGVELIGACGFGYETGGRFAQWNMRGTEGQLKAAIEADHQGGDMALKDQFPADYAAWVAAGGDPEASFRAHLMGIGRLPAGKAEAIALADSLKGTAEQIKNIVTALPN